MLGETDGIEAVFKFLAVGREIKEPLVHLFLAHGAVATPASASFHLFIGQHRVARRAPVHRREFTRRKADFHELREKPLIPLVVAWVVTLEGSTPVIGKSHPLDLLGDGSHVAFRDVVRVTALGDRSVLCWHTKGVEAHGVEHIIPHQTLETGHSVANGVISNVPHVHFSRRVWVHLKAVELGAVAVNVSVKQAGIVPLLLPPNFVHRFCFG